jgi:hypothetical protein
MLITAVPASSAVAVSVSVSSPASVAAATPRPTSPVSDSVSAWSLR